MTKSSIVSKVW